MCDNAVLNLLFSDIGGKNYIVEIMWWAASFLLKSYAVPLAFLSFLELKLYYLNGKTVVFCFCCFFFDQ